MNIHINGKTYSIDDEAQISVSSALILHFVEPHLSTFAVALNGDFVGNTDYDTTTVSNGDSLDVLLPIQGG